MQKFIPGLKLAELMYNDAVLPIIDTYLPNLQYSAAKIENGSEVLGFDTPQSMDHDWGPRFSLFLSTKDNKKYKKSLHKILANELPFEIHGIPTNYEGFEKDGYLLKATSTRPINHNIKIQTLSGFFKSYLGINPLNPIKETDWLLFSQQKLRIISYGKVFHDGLGKLEKIRELLAWYPKDIWLYLLACQWQKISQEEPFMARCGDVGDELGSSLIANRMIIEVMKLCFLMEKEYIPYIKWLGTAFSKLNCSKKLTPMICKVQRAQNWNEREIQLSKIYKLIGKIYNELNLTKPIEVKIRNFYNRPYKVLDSSRFVEVLQNKIKSKKLKSLPLVGGVDQFVDSSDIKGWTERTKSLRSIYNCK